MNDELRQRQAAFLRRLRGPWWVADPMFWLQVLPPVLLVLVVWLLAYS